MTTSTDANPGAAEAETVAAQEWSEAFGDLDLDNDTQDASVNQSPNPSSSSPSSSSSASIVHSGSSEKLSIVEPLWFLRTDELAATEQFADDTKSRVREILSFRIDRSALQHNMPSRFCEHCNQLTLSYY